MNAISIRDIPCVYPPRIRIAVGTLCKRSRFCLKINIMRKFLAHFLLFSSSFYHCPSKFHFLQRSSIYDDELKYIIKKIASYSRE